MSAANASDLAIVATSDIAAAATTISPAVSSQLAAAAKECKVPLAHLTISKLPGTAGGTIRVRSGNYLSPPFQVTDTPQRVAVPFPAAYPVGKGVISIEGNGSGTSVSLYPAWTCRRSTARRRAMWCGSRATLVDEGPRASMKKLFASQTFAMFFVSVAALVVATWVLNPSSGPIGGPMHGGGSIGSSAPRILGAL